MYSVYYLFFSPSRPRRTSGRNTLGVIWIDSQRGCPSCMPVRYSQSFCFEHVAPAAISSQSTRTQIELRAGPTNAGRSTSPADASTLAIERGGPGRSRRRRSRGCGSCWRRGRCGSRRGSGRGSRCCSGRGGRCCRRSRCSWRRRGARGVSAEDTTSVRADINTSEAHRISMTSSPQSDNGLTGRRPWGQQRGSSRSQSRSRGQRR